MKQKMKIYNIMTPISINTQRHTKGEETRNYCFVLSVCVRTVVLPYMCPTTGETAVIYRCCTLLLLFSSWIWRKGFCNDRSVRFQFSSI